MSRQTDADTLRDEIRRGRRAALARAITLVESTRPEHRELAAGLLDRLGADTTATLRVGISGVPGAGKSTLIDNLGSMLTAAGKKVAVLAVDPSSVRTGGSILGDKTRMSRLAADPHAFIRPSPSSGTLGGVAAMTRETMQLCEAAGFDVILVETMGVGQAEVKVAGMVDLVVLLMIAGGGDELQGIKKGILEIADIVAINKADGENAGQAEAAATQLRAALNILAPRSAGWKVPVTTVSGLEGGGVAALWDLVEDYRRGSEADGGFARRRAEQRVGWLRDSIEEAVRRRLFSGAEWRAQIATAEDAVRQGERAPSAVAEEMLDRVGLPRAGPAGDAQSLSNRAVHDRRPR